MNAGVLVYCQALNYLGARIHLDIGRLHALDPGADVAGIEAALAAAERTCGPQEAQEPADPRDTGRRFRWLTAPKSTVVQPGPVHTGLTSDPDADAERLLRLLVLPPGPKGAA
jgi:hypothetical protein